MSFPTKTLASRLTAMLLAMLLIMALGLGITTYVVTERFLDGMLRSAFSALASSKQTALNGMLENYTNILKGHLLHPPLDAEVIVLAAGQVPPDDARWDEARRHLRRRCLAEKLVAGVKIADRTGAVIISLDTAHEGSNIANTDTFRSGLTATKVVDMPYQEGEPFVEASGPIRDGDGTTIAVMVVRFDAHEITGLTGDYTGLGETGESVLGRRKGRVIRFLAPLRFFPNVSEQEPVPADGEIALPMLHATSGQTGIVHARDYRNERVVAVYLPLHSNGWGLVVKRDEAEVASTIRGIGLGIGLAIGLIVSVGIALILPLVRRFVEPLTELVRATNAVADGHLDVAVAETGIDEVAALAKSFNRMVHQLSRTQTDLSQANEELTQHSQALARTNQEMESFTYTVSHDLRTPLVSIRGMFDLLQKEFGDGISADARTYFSHVDEATARMDRLISDLLVFSRIGRMDTTPERLDSNEVVKQVVAEARVAAGERDIEFVVAPNLPEVLCNGKRFYQILSNLVGNAVKFTAGTPASRIQIGCDIRPRPGGAPEQVFYVRDNGPGIPGKDQERVFEMFQRLHGADVPGSGMGLAFVKRILVSLGGWIDLESSPGEGAMFSFSLLESAEETPDERAVSNSDRRG